LIISSQTLSEPRHRSGRSISMQPGRVPVAFKYQNLSAVFGKRRLKARASPSVLERSTSPPDSFDRQTVCPEYGRPTEASAMLRVLRLAAFCKTQASPPFSQALLRTVSSREHCCHFAICYVRSTSTPDGYGLRVCAKSCHCATVYRTGRTDPKPVLRARLDLFPTDKSAA
jgi:hypothetical protein